MTKKTYGELIHEHKTKDHTVDDDVIEYRRMQEPWYVKRLQEIAITDKKKPQYYNKDFYIVIHWVIEPLSGQRKPMIFSRLSCPTPVYTQACWKFLHVSGCLEFLWSIPRPMLYWDIIKSGNKFLQDAETNELAKFCFLMESGELLAWVKKENGEKEDALIKVNKEPQCLIQSP